MATRRRRATAVVLGHPERLVADHRALLAAAASAGLEAELVAPSRLALVVAAPTGPLAAAAQVRLDGAVAPVPDLILPRGVNRSWPLLRQVVAVWQRAGSMVVPSPAGIELAGDKLAAARVLAEAGVGVLPTAGVAPGPGAAPGDLPGEPAAAVVVKPARGSKAEGVEAYADLARATAALDGHRPLVAGEVDHHVVQPQATGAGVDHRVVVARTPDRGYRVVALTRRTAAPGGLVTTAPGSRVEDLEVSAYPEIAEVAVAAARALQLSFAGVDVIAHRGRMRVLEVNAWPGLAAEVRGLELAEVLVAVAAQALAAARSRGGDSNP